MFLKNLDDYTWWCSFCNNKEANQVFLIQKAWNENTSQWYDVTEAPICSTCLSTLKEEIK
jgi:hypothetical protein